MSKASPARLVVLISGRGSNLEAIHTGISDQIIPSAVLAGVISDQPRAPGLEKARAWNIPTRVIERQQMDSKQAFESALLHAVEEFSADWIILAGFMRVLSPAFLSGLSSHTLNIHPSLLPKYRGLDTHQRALDAEDTLHGASIHFVTPELDGGPVLSQVQVSVRAEDTAESLARRLLPYEHKLMIATMALLMRHAVQCVDESIYIDGNLLEKPLTLGVDLSHHGECSLGG